MATTCDIEAVGDQVITIQEAKHLMDVLDNDIPNWEKGRIALLLMILSANPKLADNGQEVVGYSPRSTPSGGYWEYQGGYEGYD